MEIVGCIFLFALLGAMLMCIILTTRADIRRAQRKEAAHLLVEYCRLKQVSSECGFTDFIEEVDFVRRELNK